MLLTIKYKCTEKDNRAKCRFDKLVNGKGRVSINRRNTLILGMIKGMHMAGIKYPLFETTYTVEKHLPMIQQYLDIKYPKLFRLSVFGTSGQMKPIWKGPNRARHELCLYLANGHYFGIRKLNTLFGAPYCIDCEGVYSNERSHRIKCLAKCQRYFTQIYFIDII